MIVVADTSVILNLCCVGHGDLLPALFHHVWIPEEVSREFQRLSQSQSRFRGLTVPLWAEVHRAPAISSQLAAQPGLHSGETAALALALENKADAVLMDESAGRRAARELGLPVIGFLGVLMQAKRSGLITAVYPIVKQLEEDAGFWLASQIVRRALSQIGEAVP